MVEIIPIPAKKQLQIIVDTEFGHELLNLLEQHEESFGLDVESRNLMDGLEFGLAELDEK